MSKILATKQYLMNSALGNVVVQNDLIQGFDVEDVVKCKATSLARSLQYINLGKDIDLNAVLPANSVPSVFAGNEEEL